MKVLINVTVDELEDKINRQILVNDDINLNDLCSNIIISMHCNNIFDYVLEYNKIDYYPGLFKETKIEKNAINYKLSDLKIKKGKSLCFEYRLDNPFYMQITIDDIDYPSSEKSSFLVLSGKGYGIKNDINYFSLRNLYHYIDSCNNPQNLLKSEMDILNKSFDYEEVNNLVKEFQEYKEKIDKPQRYEFNISLKGFNTSIKRKMVFNNNVTLNDFCVAIIRAMRGDLSHLYGIEINKIFISMFDEYVYEKSIQSSLELKQLFLKEKQKFKVIYDYGDDWQFDVTLNKMIDEYNYNSCEVISGKGYGIVDDCGGIWGLKSLFNGESLWDDGEPEEYNIEDFNLEECNKDVKQIFNIKD